MKIYVLVQDYGYDGGESPLGVFPSAEAAMEGAEEHTIPKGLKIAWKPVHSTLSPELVIGIKGEVTGDRTGYPFEIKDFELALGGSAEADAAVLQAAAEILKRRFGTIATEHDRQMLERAAQVTEHGAQPPA